MPTNTERDDAVAVVFRRWPEIEGGDVIALFPTVGEGPGFCASYQHVGQHGTASLSLIEGLEKVGRADPDVLALRQELESIGYRLAVREESSDAD